VQTMDEPPQIYTRTDFEAGLRAGWLDTAVRRCPRCAASDPWVVGGCRGCGTNETPVFACPKCDKLLDSVTFDYEARSSGGKRYVKPILGDQCSNCSTVFAYKLFVEELDEFVESTPHDLEIIPEVGIQTSGGSEVFVLAVGDDVESHFEYEVESAAIGGLRVGIGRHSELFEKCLDQVTSYDTSDYGHDMSPTLQIHPGPPYSAVVRREIQVLLSRLCRDSGVVLTFWSMNFEPPWEDEASPLRKLGQVLETSPLDEDRVCLALVNNISAGVEPSKFVNTFRLLETVVNRLLEQRIRKARFDASVDHVAFLRIVRFLQADLKTRLREAVKAKAGDPTSILKRVWRILEPGRGYNQDEIFDRIARIRNYSVHSPADPEEAIMLPWESKPLGQIAEHVLEVAVFLLEEITTATPE
jgi:hypothetical protein